MFFRTAFSNFLILLICSLVFSCSRNEDHQEETKTIFSSRKKDTLNDKIDSLTDKGIGPIKSVELGAVDIKLAEKGKNLFENKCSSCHKSTDKYVGPSLLGVTKRRSPEWIMNMILNPEEMLKKDPIGKKLLNEYYSEMVKQDTKEEEARAMLEYFRQDDAKKGQ